ncbi:hypothetical protein LMTR3_12335 [Bradyrhizobium sp. LMTR 3]|nr:hypothetical protein LMTR3_12335 [Bradyrhizobium sp. LMTR 3]
MHPAVCGLVARFGATEVIAKVQQPAYAKLCARRVLFNSELAVLTWLANGNHLRSATSDNWRI